MCIVGGHPSKYKWYFRIDCFNYKNYCIIVDIKSTELIKQNKKWDLMDIIINFLITSSDFQHYIPVQLQSTT